MRMADRIGGLPDLTPRAAGDIGATFLSQPYEVLEEAKGAPIQCAGRR